VLLQASYLGFKERQLFKTFEKTARQGGFFVYSAKDYDEMMMISRRSFMDEN